MELMATKTSERVLQMKENFWDLHLQGFSIPEIANMYGLSPSTVYSYLDKIAQEHEVSREELLQQVHKTPAYWERQEASMKANGEDIAKGFDSILESISGLQGTITDAIIAIDAALNNNKEDFER